jgi:hypothetical protein
MLVLGSLLFTSGCSSAPRIDGRSDVAFDESHSRLLASLEPGDRLRLLLAEAIVLTPRGCLTKEPIPGASSLNDVLGGQVVVRSCRRELHGLSFNDVMELAYPNGEPTSQPGEPPN